MSGSTWRLIQGGAWTPDARIVDKIQQHLRAYIESRIGERPLPAWTQFQFAYQGQHTESPDAGMPYVFIAAYWLAPMSAGLSARFHAVPRDGHWRFTVKYRADLHRFYDLQWDDKSPVAPVM